MHHAAGGKGETIVQISGTGPFDIHYLNPADNPNPKTDDEVIVTPLIAQPLGSSAASPKRAIIR